MKQDEIDYLGWKNLQKVKRAKRKLVEEALKSRKVKPKPPQRKLKKESKTVSKNNRIYSGSAGRGTGMMNRLESKASLPVVIPKEGREIRLLTLRDKIIKLLDKYPDNDFYKSLNRWKGSYTEKQADSIETNFRKCFLSEFLVEESKKKQALKKIGEADHIESHEDDCPF